MVQCLRTPKREQTEENSCTAVASGGVTTTGRRLVRTHVHVDGDGVAAADGVAGALEVVGEAHCVAPLYVRHAVVVKLSDCHVNGLAVLLRLIAEAANVGGKEKTGF